MFNADFGLINLKDLARSAIMISEKNIFFNYDLKNFKGVRPLLYTLVFYGAAILMIFIVEVNL